MVPFCIWNRGSNRGGRGGIRTHGGLPHARFRVECLKPDSATLPSSAEETSNAEHPTSNIECNFRSVLGVQGSMVSVSLALNPTRFRRFPMFLFLSLFFRPKKRPQRLKL